MNHQDFNAHLAMVRSANFTMRAFKAHIAAFQKPTFALTIYAIDMAHAVRECEAMLLEGDSLTVEALQ